MRLDDPRFAATLKREHDAAARQRYARGTEGASKGGRQPVVDFRTSERHRTSYLAIGPDQGRFLHALALATKAKRIVEFGTSYGISALYLASAAAANEGLFVGSEYHAEKATQARATLRDAGLGGAEVRVGDARETLADLSAGIDLLFLDGAKDLYRPMLDLLEPQLRPGAVVVADNIAPDRPEIREFLDRIEDAGVWVTSYPRFGKGSMSLSIRL